MDPRFHVTSAEDWAAIRAHTDPVSQARMLAANLARGIAVRETLEALIVYCEKLEAELAEARCAQRE